MQIISMPKAMASNSYLFPMFRGDMTREDIESWNSDDFATVYMNLQSLMLDLNDLDTQNNRNFLHYVLKFDNPAIVEELNFRLQTFDKEELEKLVEQTDKYGKKPLDYCSSPESRKIYADIFSDILGKNLASFNEAVKASYMPISKPKMSLNPTPTVSIRNFNEVNDDAVGNELNSDTVIPEMEDLDFGFGMEDEEINYEEVTSDNDIPANQEVIKNSKKEVKNNSEAIVEDKELFRKSLEIQPKNLDEIVGLDKVKELLKKDLIEPLSKENLSKLNGNNLKIEKGNYIVLYNAISI